MHFAVFTFALIVPAAAVAAVPASLPLKAAPTSIDKLFSQLAQASSSEEAKPIEDKIEAQFLQSQSPTVDLLMTRAAASEQAQDMKTARTLLNSIVTIAPDYAEGWRRLGNLQAAQNDDAGAMLSLQRAVQLNPRHFAAMSELADMLEDYGDKKAALMFYRKALALDPQMDGAARHLRALEKEIEGVPT
jgi:tetratricopeptide (TPR) repeat protein